MNRFATTALALSLSLVVPAAVGDENSDADLAWLEASEHAQTAVEACLAMDGRRYWDFSAWPAACEDPFYRVVESLLRAQGLPVNPSPEKNAAALALQLGIAAGASYTEQAAAEDADPPPPPPPPPVDPCAIDPLDCWDQWNPPLINLPPPATLPPRPDGGTSECDRLDCVPDYIPMPQY